ncbi:hypothetical protein GCM10010470_11270 [Saccharopolyspora taberi]|uniref:Uncharacterized protein n=1 Tax=Saccharopolyspora taberi TaxID=60895 RepID=A0ABN3V5X8_9PSEU
MTEQPSGARSRPGPRPRLPSTVTATQSQVTHVTLIRVNDTSGAADAPRTVIARIGIFARQDAIDSPDSEIIGLSPNRPGRDVLHKATFIEMDTTRRIGGSALIPQLGS